MAAGDAGRTWFPEMIAVLRGEWSPAMTFDQLIALRDRLESLLREIRTSRNILPPMGRCPRCGTYERQGEPHVSVRAMILCLRRFQIADEAEVKALEKRWQKFRKETGADLNGQMPDTGVQRSADSDESTHGRAEHERRAGRASTPRASVSAWKRNNR